MRKIVHIDMDAFFASVEQRDCPKYRGKPIVVGGTPKQRGAVAAASYEARKFGIHSAMPSRIAQQRCSQLLFVPPRFEVYRQISLQIREIFLRYTDRVEPLSLDEAYLDVTENNLGIASATQVARMIRQEIRRTTSLTASAGVSINKFLAKVATEIRKPNGLYTIPPEQAQTFVESLAIERFFGVGPATAAKMQVLGVKTGADLKRLSLEVLIEQFGKRGAYFYDIARARDERPVDPKRLRKSVGVEHSFARDLGSQTEVLEVIRLLASELEARMEKHHCLGRTLTLKVKYSNYEQVTRSLTLEKSLRGEEAVFEIARDLLGETDVETRAVRLLGLTMSNLTGGKDRIFPQQLSLPLSHNH